MPSPATKFAVSTTPGPVGGTTGIPTRGVGSVLVLNSSEGIADSPNAPDIIVDNSTACALTPQQVGVRLIPGQLMEFSLRSPVNLTQLPLWAVADGADGAS